MIGSWALKARVEENLGVALAPGFFDKAEQYAWRKLDLCNERAGRQYGEDGYGDEYLVLLTADTVREMAFSEYTMIRSAEIMAEAAAGGKAVEAREGESPVFRSGNTPFPVGTVDTFSSSRTKRRAAKATIA